LTEISITTPDAQNCTTPFKGSANLRLLMCLLKIAALDFKPSPLSGGQRHAENRQPKRALWFALVSHALVSTAGPANLRGTNDRGLDVKGEDLSCKLLKTNNGKTIIR
jgi:hypothetical protein